MTDKPDLAEVMLNVRKAYRFLGEFNRRLQGILSTVKDEFSLDHLHWQPMHHARLEKANKSPLERWSWDSLPLYNFRLFYLSSEPAWMLEVAVEMDSQFNKNGADGWPNPKDFGDVEKAQSRLYLIARWWHQDGSNVAWHSAWQQAWQRSGYHLVGEQQNHTKNVLEDKEGNPFSVLGVYELLQNLEDGEQVRQFCQKAKAAFNAHLNLNLNLEET